MTNRQRRELLKTGVPWLAAGVGLGSGSVAGPVAANTTANPNAAAAAPGVPRLGINLAEAVDWNTELPFVDLFRTSRDWISQLPNGDWGKGPKLALDESGVIKALEPGHHADTPMMSATDVQYPSGTYTLTWQGDGELDVWGSGRITSSGNGRASVDANPSRGALFVRLKRTNPNNPVRTIRLLRPGASPDAPLNAFSEDFLNRWRGVSCVRFMDWQRTNNSRQVRWSERPKATDARFSERGVAIEVMVDLCNRLEADPWFCIPHLADEDYVTQFATLVRAQLKPDRKAYIEFSNELWNGMFEQARLLTQQAQSGRSSVQALVAERSLAMFRIWERVFGSRDRLVRVLPTQAASTWFTETMLKHGDAHRQGDVVAIAPYLSLNVPMQGEGLTASKIESWSVEQLLDHLEKVALPECTGWMRAQKALAERFGLKLVAYEGGQHLVGIFGAENNDKLTRLLHAANSHPRMGQLYERYLDAWSAAGGDLFCHFNSVSAWSKWGTWGLLRHALEDASKSPKFMATMRWARKQGQPVKLPG